MPKIALVSTPIGNLSDLSERARQTLENADWIACEDTRRTGALLHHLGLRKRLVSLHQHNERRRTEELLGAVQGGARVVVVSDAGTPLICDPGFLLVRAALERGLEVEANPGASALLCALTVSGLPPYPFTFLGFPPPKSGRRRTFFRRYAELEHTLVVYESPHRLLKSLGDALEIFGDREVAIARELTKLHEEILRGRLREVIELLAVRDRLRGEFVIVLAGAAG